MILSPRITANLDLESISIIDGDYWVVSKGHGLVDDEASPPKTPNLLVCLDDMAVIQEIICLHYHLHHKPMPFKRATVLRLLLLTATMF
jgi:hypothetical protein